MVLKFHWWKHIYYNLSHWVKISEWTVAERIDSKDIDETWLACFFTVEIHSNKEAERDRRDWICRYWVIDIWCGTLTISYCSIIKWELSYWSSIQWEIDCKITSIVYISGKRIVSKNESSKDTNRGRGNECESSRNSLSRRKTGLFLLREYLNELCILTHSVNEEIEVKQLWFLW